MTYFIHNHNTTILRRYKSRDELIHQQFHWQPPHRKVTGARLATQSSEFDTHGGRVFESLQ